MRTRFWSISIFFLFVVATLVSSSYADLMGAWLLDGDASDASGRGHDGLPENMEWVTDGRFGGAAAVTADNGHITIATHADLDLFVHTIMAWVRNPGASDGRRVLVDKTCFGCYAGLPSNYSMGSHEAGHLHFWHRKGPMEPHGDVWVDSPKESHPILHDGNWHHLAGQYNGNSMKIFLDGEQVAERGVDQGQAGGPHAPGIVDAPVMIGAMSPDGGNGWTAGTAFDEAAIFNSVLTADEIRSIYANGLADAGFVSSAAVDAGGKLSTTWATLKAK